MDRYSIYSKKTYHLARLFLFLSLLFPVAHCFAQDAQIEYKIKAGYLYNFTKFITWHENNLNTFNLCIVGDDPFGQVIDPIETKLVKNKQIRLFRINSTDDIKHCQIVYFSSLEFKRPLNTHINGVLTIASLNQSLTVGESIPFVNSGGMIAFFIEDGKVKLYINVKALKKSGLDISAKLLEVADLYEGLSDD